MDLLNSHEEKILDFLIKQQQDCFKTNLKEIAEHFEKDYSHKALVSFLYQIEEKGYIKTFMSDNEKIGVISVLSLGHTYFIDKQETACTLSAPVVNINNSTGINVGGNNNTVNINKGLNFDETSKLIDEQYSDYEEMLNEILEMLQNEIKSHPISESKMPKLHEFLKKGAAYFQPVVTSMFNDLLKHFFNIG